MENLISTVVKRITVLLCVIAVFGTSSHAQVVKRKKPASSPNQPIITSPAGGSVINGPFVMVGKAEPNATVTLTVTPVYKLPKNTTGKPTLVVTGDNYKKQEFTFAANDKGLWQSPMIEVMFDDKTLDRKIYAMVSQQWGSSRASGKMIEFLASPKLTMIMTTLNVPLKSKEENNTSDGPRQDEKVPIKGGDDVPFKISSPGNNKYVAHDDFSIAGISGKGARVKVEVRYSGYKSTSNLSVGNIGPVLVPKIDKNTSRVNDELWGTYTVNSPLGIWVTDDIKLVKRIDGYSCWANTYTITASLVNENGKLVRPVTVNVSRMKTKAIK